MEEDLRAPSVDRVRGPRLGGSGEPAAGLLRPGNAGLKTAADHIEATRLALAQLPKRSRRGRQTLIRTNFQRRLPQVRSLAGPARKVAGELRRHDMAITDASDFWLASSGVRIFCICARTAGRRGSRVPKEALLENCFSSSHWPRLQACF